MKESYETISIVRINDEGTYGTCEKLGAFASVIKHVRDGVEYETLMDNDEFMIMDEITFVHVEEDN